MKITLIAIGKLKEKWLREAVEMYRGRIAKYADINIVEVNDAPDTLPLEKILRKEAEAVIQKIPHNSSLILFDLHGKAYTSEEFAQALNIWFEMAGANLTFVIGGSRGIDDELRKLAVGKVKLSNMTFPHQLTRVIALEQIYRSFKINNGENYHK